MSRSSVMDSERSGGPRKYNFTVDQLFPSETNKSGTRGKRLDINTIFSNTATNPDVVIDMSHEVLIERRKKRKEEIKRQYMLAYQNCWKKIDASDGDGLFETIFEVIDALPQFPEYSSIDCLALIQNKLRTEEYMDTVILKDNLSIYINWENIEANKAAYLESLKGTDTHISESDQNEQGVQNDKQNTQNDKQDEHDEHDNVTDTKARINSDTAPEIRKEFDVKMQDFMERSN